jgi:serine/threonine kinase PknH
VNPLASLQIIDYREPTVDAGIQLVSAVHALQSKPVPLPDPLPEEPPVPFGYITRLGNQMAEKELSPQLQLQLLVELRSGLDEDGDDPSARGDIAQLLRMLRLRHDVTYRTRSEIDNVLAEIEAKDGAAGTTAAADATTVKTATTPPAAATPPPPSAPPAASADAGSGSNKKVIIIGAAALAVIAVIAIVVVMATQGGKTKPAPKAGPAPTSSVSSGGGPAPNSGTGSKLDTDLVGLTEVSAIVNDPNLVVGERFSQLRTPKWSLSAPECAGAYEPAVAAGYDGAAGLSALSGQIIHTSGTDQVRRIIQAVVSFSSPDQAAAFVAASADKWKACPGKTVTETLNGHTYDWVFADVTGELPRIAQERTRADHGKICHHVLHAASNNVIDVLTCGPEAGNGEAGKIAEKISAKIGA